MGSMVVVVGGRQENSLRTVHYNSEVLYTNTGWSVCNPLGLALQIGMGAIYTYMVQGNESAVCQSSNMCCTLLRTESSSL